MRPNKLIQFYITNMCNSHCKTCSIWRTRPEDREELRVQDMEKVVSGFRYADYVIGGGEAILHSDIDLILDMFNYYGVNYTLLSNCILNENLKTICRKFEVKNVTVSYDGIRHDSLRGSFRNADKIWGFVRWAESEGINVKLSYTYSVFNEDTFEDDMQSILDEGIEKIYFCLAHDMDLLKIGNSVRPHNLEKLRPYYFMFDDKDINFIESMIDPNKTKSICNSQSSVHTIYSNGDIVRCQSYMSTDVIGNIRDMSLKEVNQVFNSIKCIDCKYDSMCNLLCQRRYD